MKTVLNQLVVLLAISTIALLLTVPAAKAEVDFGNHTHTQFGKVELTHQDSAGPTTVKLASRRGTGATKAAGLPSFQEIPHGAPELGDQYYVGSYWDRNNQLVDVYQVGGITISAGTGHHK